MSTKKFIDQIPSLVGCKEEFIAEVQSYADKAYSEEIAANGKSLFAFNEEKDFDAIGNRFEFFIYLLRRAGGKEELINYCILLLGVCMFSHYEKENRYGDKAKKMKHAALFNIYKTEKTPEIQAIDAVYSVEQAEGGFWAL